jgi:hypothetical protein
MSTKNPGLELLERRVDELGLRREVEDELAPFARYPFDLDADRGVPEPAVAGEECLPLPSHEHRVKVFDFDVPNLPFVGYS